MPPTYRIEALTRQHDRSSFNCGEASLDRYLQQQARQEADKHVAAPFVLVQDEAPSVLGFYTLSSSVLQVGDVDPALARTLPRYPLLPVVLIGRLAIDLRQQGQGRGAFMLMDALRRSLETTHQVAAMAVVVDAKDDNAAAFYGAHGFFPLQSDLRQLYLPMKSIQTLFPRARAEARALTLCAVALYRPGGGACLLYPNRHR